MVLDKLEGASAPALSAKVAAHAARTAASPAAAASRAAVPDLASRLSALLHSAPVMLFMKGEPSAARCGFSRKVVEALTAAGAPFSHFDILTDADVREGLKKLSDWPTYPQLYVNGELVGGCDIVLELAASGELQKTLQAATALPLPPPPPTAVAAAVDAQSLEARLKALLASAPVMLFMKGQPDEPRCGFSRKVVEALTAAGAPFSHFDILTDADVREGLKKLSDWPTYPQLYVNGELVGGCDIVLELAASGELQKTLQGTA